MAISVPEATLRQAWAEWQREHNARGLRMALTLVGALHPLFAALDVGVARGRTLRFLLANRLVGEAIVVVLLLNFRKGFVRRWLLPISTAYMFSVALSIVLMTVVLGGLGSPYYAGLNLVMLGSGLLYVWPLRASVLTNAAIFTSYVALNLAVNGPAFDPASLSGVTFVLATAIIVSAGHHFAYANAHEQISNRLALELAGNDIASAHQKLQQLDQFKSRFFANITHELKTPLAMILSPVELMIDGEFGPVTEPQRATLRSVHRNGARLLRLIGDLLDLSRIEESRLRLRLNEVDLVTFLRGLTDQVAPMTERKEIATRFTTTLQALPLWIDAERMERVFVNLLSNAAKFTPVQGEITISLVDHDDRVEVSVQDTGPGFPQELSERLFERFFQVSGGASENRYTLGGTGIGLALARELVELHGGSIRAESRPGEGARFTVTLRKGRGHFRPEQIDRRARSVDVPSDRRSSVDPSQWSQDVALRGDMRFLALSDATERRVVERDVDESERARTVLVVEDTLEVVRIVHLVLRADFRVLTAPDGRRGFDLAMRHRPDLIITDLMMPEMDGFELVQLLRKTPQTKHIPVVMLTARGAVDDRIAGLESGVDAYLTKPFAARELRTTVRKLLQSTDATAERVLTHQMDSLETVTGGLAHEINNPLNYIKNALARIRLDVRESGQIAARIDDPEARKRVEALNKRAEQMFDVASSGVTRIAGTVSLMGRYSREGYVRAAVPYDAFQALRDVVGVVSPAIDRPVRVTVAAEGEGLVECVPEELNQLITNLVQNAIEASPDDGTGVVSVTGEREGDRVVIKVQDTGPGIKPEDRARIFAPFFTTKAPGRGMGLGLTIVWRVVQSLGGTVAIEGAAGEGAVFVVRLPAAESLRTRDSGEVSSPAAE